jgi:hypothetical protein
MSPSCPDFDLCESCEASGGKHDESHHLLKIRQPVDHTQNGNGGGVVDAAKKRAEGFAAKGAIKDEIAELVSSGPIANLLNPLGVHLPSSPSRTASTTSTSAAAVVHPETVEVVSSPNGDKTVYVDVDVSQLSREELRGLPSEVKVDLPIEFDEEKAREEGPYEVEQLVKAAEEEGEETEGEVEEEKEKKEVAKEFNCTFVSDVRLYLSFLLFRN